MLESKVRRVGEVRQQVNIIVCNTSIKRKSIGVAYFGKHNCVRFNAFMKK